MTTEKKLKILFVQAKNRTNRTNQSPLYCRITLNGDRKQLNTGIQIESEYWDSKNQTILKSHESAILINSQLHTIKSKIINIYMILKLQENAFTVDDIYNKYIGNQIKSKEYILSYYNQYLFKIEKLIGLEIKENTYNKFVYVRDHLEAFLKWKFKKKDFPLEELNLQFLDDLNTI